MSDSIIKSDFVIPKDTIKYRSSEDIKSALNVLEILKGKTITKIKEISTISIVIAQYNSKLQSVDVVT